MGADRKHTGSEGFESHKPLDQREESGNSGSDSKRPDVARKMGRDDLNDDNSLGRVSSPDGDSAGENKVATSLSED